VEETKELLEQELLTNPIMVEVGAEEEVETPAMAEK
tara:strand:- start:10 stop:117 length:108 start_codon:yes stop_codon:yes gene_type:complete